MPRSVERGDDRARAEQVLDREPQRRSRVARGELAARDDRDARARRRAPAARRGPPRRPPPALRRPPSSTSAPVRAAASATAAPLIETARAAASSPNASPRSTAWITVDENRSTSTTTTMSRRREPGEPVDAPLQADLVRRLIEGMLLPGHPSSVGRAARVGRVAPRSAATAAIAGARLEHAHPAEARDRLRRGCRVAGRALAAGGRRALRAAAGPRPARCRRGCRPRGRPATTSRCS